MVVEVDDLLLERRDLLVRNTQLRLLMLQKVTTKLVIVVFTIAEKLINRLLPDFDILEPGSFQIFS